MQSRCMSGGEAHASLQEPPWRYEKQEHTFTIVRGMGAGRVPRAESEVAAGENNNAAGVGYAIY